jgi:hypothetical protein
MCDSVRVWIGSRVPHFRLHRVPPHNNRSASRQESTTTLKFDLARESRRRVECFLIACLLLLSLLVAEDEPDAKAILPEPRCVQKKQIPISSQGQLSSILKAHLTPDEIARGVAYCADSTFTPGTKIDFPGIHIDVPWEAFLVFVDREPTANWSHSCRYILINCENGEMKSFEGQLPPFRPDRDFPRWRVLYKAPTVPDAVLAVPQQATNHNN